MITTKFRDKAILWLKSKSRSFNEGLDILQKSGFKPSVARRLTTLGDGDISRLHLVENLRQYIQYSGGKVEDTDGEMGVFKGKQPEVLKQKEVLKGKSIDVLSKEIKDGKVTGCSDAAKKLIFTYAKLYRQREMCHRKMFDFIDLNDDNSIARRKDLSDKIQSYTSEMERIYPSIEAYIEQGKEPKDIPAAKPKVKNSRKIKAEGNYDSMSLTQLKKIQKSVKTKILRKNNLLLYQQETKAEKENPLPDCPKRVKYEKEIKRLEEELLKIQYAIAAK